MPRFMVTFARVTTERFVVDLEADTAESARDRVASQLDARTLIPPGSAPLSTDHDADVTAVDVLEEFGEESERVSDLGFISWGEVAPDGATAEDFDLWMGGNVVGTTRG